MSIDAPLALKLGFSGAWLVFGVLLVDRQLLAAESRAQVLSLVALFFFTLLLDTSIATGGPGDLRLNLGAIWSPGVELRWGPAPIELFRLMRDLVPHFRDTHILWVNILLSSLLPVLLYAVIAHLGINRLAALLASFVVASHPLLIVFSGVLNRQPLYLFAAFGSILALIGFLTRGTWRHLIAFVLGTVLATTSRPEGGQVLIAALAVVLFGPARPQASSGGGRARSPGAAERGLRSLPAEVGRSIHEPH